MIDKGDIFSILIKIAHQNGLRVLFADFKSSDGRILGKRIGIRAGMDIGDINYNLAHELAHYFLHYDKGDIINSPLHDVYEEQADKYAMKLLRDVAVHLEAQEREKRNALTRAATLIGASNPII